MTKKIVVSRDVIFDELSSWYNPKQNVETDEDNENEDRNKSENERDCHGNGNKVGQQSPTSIACTGSSENSGSKSESNAWSGKNVSHKKYDDKKGKQKMPEYEMLDEGKLIHAYVVESGFLNDVSVGSALVNMYNKCGDLGLAKSLFDEMSIRDVVSWNGLITAYVQHGHVQDALHTFSSMLSDHNVQPNVVTFTVILNACVSEDALVDCMIIHDYIMEAGCEYNVMIGNALINSYGKCESFFEARMVFQRMPQRDVVSWNTLILVCAQNGYRREALKFFHLMQSSGIKPSEISYIIALSLCTIPIHIEDGKLIHLSAKDNRLDSNSFVANSLLCMYSNCGSAESAHQMFEKIQDHSMMTWNAIISACDRHGLGMEAQKHFWQMLREGFTPNEYALTSVVSACASTVALEEGKLMHSLASENSFDSDDVFMNALVSMYGRCGSVEDALTMFKMMRNRTVVTWTAMLASYAQHGRGQEAIQLFHQMHSEGFEPNEISFVSVLSACSHTGLVFEGCYYFSSMFQEFEVTPVTIHFSCLMDLFGRTGTLDIAAHIINQMPFQPESDEWYTFLCACKSLGDVRSGICAAEQVLELYHKHSAAYVSLSNIYASAGAWEEV